MCGRYTLSTPSDDLALLFDISELMPLPPRYNLAPTQEAAVVRVKESGGPRRLDLLKWGLIPYWAKEAAIGNKLINARSETVVEKASFKTSFKNKRCLIPADGFYEWRKVPGGKRKQPYFVHRPDGEPFAFAGLWEVWRGPKDDEGNRTGEPLRSCTIITTTPNEVMAEVHDRMPVILPPSAWDEWLDPDNDDIETLGRLLVPAPAGITELRPVSTQVNSVRNKGVELIVPASPDEMVG